MIPELSLIKLFLKHNLWKTYSRDLSVKDFPQDIQGVARALYAYHSEHEEDLSLDDLANIYFATNPPNRDFMVGVFDNLRTIDVKEQTCVELLQGIRRSKLLRDLSIAAYETVEGRLAVVEFDKLYDQYTALKKAPVESGEELEFVSSDLEQLVNGILAKPGLRWRLATLNHMLGSLRGGDFGFLFARPETGKTTFLASEVTHMAEQAQGNILWFNNEEQGEKVMLRCIQAALGLDMVTLMRDVKKWRDAYLSLTGDKIKILDRAKISQKAVEQACDKYKPSLIVFDQIDKIESPANDREDLRLGAIYQWARELAKIYAAPVIGVSQADGTGEGVKWLTMAHVANAKTAKQAEADWILGIGKSNTDSYEYLRYLHASKNKLIGDEDTVPEWRHGRKEVLIRPDIARYEDLGEE